MSLQNKIAIFDFCDTLVAGQTGDQFILRILDPYPIRKAKYFLLCGSRLIRNKKNYLYRLCHGISSSHIKRVASNYAESLKPRIKPNVNEILQKWGPQNSVIVSAGYAEYIRELYPNYKVIANEFIFINNKVSTQIPLKDCFGYEKISRLLKEVDIKGKEISTFSDCISDLPLFKLGRGFLVIGDEIYELRNFKH